MTDNSNNSGGNGVLDGSMFGYVPASEIEQADYSHDLAEQRAKEAAGPMLPAPSEHTSVGPAPERPAAPVAMPLQSVMVAPQSMVQVEPPAVLSEVWKYGNAHMLGISTVVVATCTIVGMRFGGLYGAVAGSLAGGSALNALRAAKVVTGNHPEARREALVSGSYALIAAGLSGYLIYVGHKHATGKKKWS